MKKQKDNGENQRKEQGEWKRCVTGEKERITMETREKIMFITLTIHTHTRIHKRLCRTYYCTAPLGIKSQMQNTLEKLTTKPTNTESVKLLLRK